MLAEPRADVRGTLSAAHQRLRRDPLRRPRQFAGVAVRNHDAESAQARGYESGLFGKFHLTGSDINEANNPLGYTAVHQLGWDYFAGWQDGAPHPIDTTAGGVAPTGVSYPCGFVPNATDDPVNGADTGACYFVDQSCAQITRSPQLPTPGRACLEHGGIFAPKARMQRPVPATVNFALQNGYYAGQLVINRPDGTYTVTPPQDPSGCRARLSVDHRERPGDRVDQRRDRAETPWMATVSYSSAHTPYQQPPTALLPAGVAAHGRFNCLANEADQRVLSNQMIEAMDAEIGRVLVETGIATRGKDGSAAFDPERSDTMIVIMGDNGTYAPGVKAPFNPLRAKATVYQTGVWVPLIVAGPLVKAPGRQVSAMVNIADVFQLFGEIAGIDVHKVVPTSRPLDSVSMLPYLAEPPTRRACARPTSRRSAGNIKAAGYVVPPCVIASVNTCIQLFPTQELCASEGGVWWGAPDTDRQSAAAPRCGRAAARLLQREQVQPGAIPAASRVLRAAGLADGDARRRLQARPPGDHRLRCDDEQLRDDEATELYAIDEDVPPKLDNAERNLLAPPHTLDRAERKALASLTRRWTSCSIPRCRAPATAISTVSSIRRTSISSTTGPT